MWWERKLAKPIRAKVSLLFKQEKEKRREEGENIISCEHSLVMPHL